VEEFARPVLADHGVVLTSAAGVYDPGLAESVLGFLLALSARILEDARLSPGSWPADGTRLLRGTTALIVGAGSIGTETGRLLRAAGLRVRGIARTPRPPDDVFERVAGPGDLLGELAEADHVVNVLPRTPSTERMFDADAFAAMKPTASFVNIGRSTSSRSNRCLRTARCGRCRTSSCHRTARAITRTGRATSSRCSWTTSGGTSPASRSATWSTSSSATRREPVPERDGSAPVQGYHPARAGQADTDRARHRLPALLLVVARRRAVHRRRVSEFGDPGLEHR
jgi:hypothetical protein